MNRRFILLCAMGCALGLGIGMLMPHMKTWFAPTQPAGLAPIELPTDGVHSDAFSLHLLQAALQAQPNADSVTVAPAAVATTLAILRDSAAGSTAEQLDALRLPTRELDNSFSNVIIGADDSLPLLETRGSVQRFPFRSDYPTALSLFNTCLSGGTLRLGSAALTRETRFVAAYVTEVTPEWALPLHRNTKHSSFDNANGGMPDLQLLRADGKFRVAEAEDGSWKAVALFLNDRSASPCALVCVLPSDHARRFTEQLSPEQLSTIRSALAKAEPKEGSIELPVLQITTAEHNDADILRAMGVSSLFDARSADFSPLTKEKVSLNGLWGRIALRCAPDAQEADSDAGKNEVLFTADKPFLWFVSDLTTPAPPYLMGLIENL